MRALLMISVASNVLLSSCGSSESPPAGQDRREGAQQPAGDDRQPVDMNAKGTGGKPDFKSAGATVRDRRLLDVKMAVSAKTMGIKACNGDLQFRLSVPDEGDENVKLFEIPADNINCVLAGHVSLKELLEGKDAGPEARPPQIDRTLYVERGAIFFRRLVGEMDYDTPGLPFFPAFLSATPQQLRGVDFAQNVTGRSWDNKTLSRGHVKVKMLSYYPKFQHAAMNREFAEVYDFEILITGFDGVNRFDHLLFDRMFLRFSLKPFAPLRLEFDTRVSQIVHDPTKTGLFDGIKNALGNIVPVYLTADLMAMDGLPDAGADDDMGEEFSGAPDPAAKAAAGKDTETTTATSVGTSSEVGGSPAGG